MIVTEADNSPINGIPWYENHWFFVGLILGGVVLIAISVFTSSVNLVSVISSEFGVALVIASILSLTIQRLEVRQHKHQTGEFTKLADGKIEKLVSASFDKIGAEVLEGGEEVWAAIREYIFQVPILINRDVTTLTLKPIIETNPSETYVQLTIETHQELKNRTMHEQPYSIQISLNSDFHAEHLSIIEVTFESDSTVITFKRERDDKFVMINPSTKEIIDVSSSFKRETIGALTYLVFKYEKMKIKPHEKFSIRISESMSLRKDDSFFKSFNRPALGAIVNLSYDFSGLDGEKYSFTSEVVPFLPATTKGLPITYMRQLSSLSWEIYKPFLPKNGYMVVWSLKEKQ